MKTHFKPKITVFHCINTFSDDSLLPVPEKDMFELKTIQMPCSSMVKDVFLLRAFEAGADAVIVFVCPEGACRYLEGNIRAKKRINRVKNLLDEIGLDGRRLSISNMSSRDERLASKVIADTLATLENLGPNPAV